MSKGKQFERDISRKLSLWLTGGKDKDLIWYTKSSGGVATKRRKKNHVTKHYDFGDLGPDGPGVEYFFDVFSCELKTGYGTKNKKSTTLWSLLDIIDGKQKVPTFIEFWEQAERDAKLSDREPILIFRRNRRSECIAMYEHIWGTFMKARNDTTPKFTTISVDLNRKDEIVICNLDDFLEFTWGKVTENFIKLKINRVIMGWKRHG